MKLSVLRMLSALLLWSGLAMPAPAAEDRWADVVRKGPMEYRVGHVWTVALSTTAIPKLVADLGEGAIPALIDSLGSDDERLVQGALWILCQLPDKAAKAACTDYDVAPKPVFQPKPYFPFDAFAKHVEGTVSVRFLIGSNGDVVHADVGRSVKMLDMAALHCVRRWKFEPAQRKSKAIPCVATAPVTFRITSGGQ